MIVIASCNTWPIAWLEYYFNITQLSYELVMKTQMTSLSRCPSLDLPMI